ncbi:MAG: hypothetical protein VX185_05820 [Pseudomonadota bacterium]|nr:hypothetical protein [Pseudomonadota bacterium]
MKNFPVGNVSGFSPNASTPVFFPNKDTALSSITSTQDIISQITANRGMTDTASFQRVQFIESHPFAGLVTDLKTATPQEIATQGQIKRIHPDLSLGHLVDKNNKVLYFAREKMNDDRAVVWTHFGKHINAVAMCLRTALYSHFKSKPEGHTASKDLMNYFFNTAPQNAVVNHLVHNFGLTTETSTSLAAQMDDVGIGASVFNPFKSIEEDNRYVMYVSSKPITGFAMDHLIKPEESDYEEFYQLKEFSAHAGHIQMAVTSGLEDNVHEHRGIFKTPFAMMNAVKPDYSDRNITKGGLSMALQLFGFACAKAEGIKYGTISPVDSMANILAHNKNDDIDKGNIIVGTKALKQAKLYRCVRESEEGEVPMVLKLNSMTNELWR